MSSSLVRYRRLKAAGLCVDCGKVPPGQKSTVCCDPCRLKRNARSLASFHKTKSGPGEQPRKVIGGVFCAECRSRIFAVVGPV